MHKKLFHGTKNMWYSFLPNPSPSSSFLMLMATCSMSATTGRVMKMMCCTLEDGRRLGRNGNIRSTSYSFRSEYSATRPNCSVSSESQTNAYKGHNSSKGREQFYPNSNSAANSQLINILRVVHAGAPSRSFNSATTNTVLRRKAKCPTVQ